MSPAELVREKALSLLADPGSGINPTFVASCRKRRIQVPSPGSENTPSAPFDFTPDSPNVLRISDDVSWIESRTEIQYPLLLASVLSSKQIAEGRILGARFHGIVTVALSFFIAWPTQIDGGPANNNFETHLDALEEAIITVLNSNPSGWVPVLYSNFIDFQRTPLVLTNSSQLYRRSLSAHLSALVNF